MNKMRIIVKEEKYKCEICGHEWNGRGVRVPAVCPNTMCHSYNWNKSGIVQDLTVPVEAVKLELQDIDTIKRFESDYGFPLETFMRNNK